MNPIDGGPAFPVGSGDMRDPVGMTLRDYFAAKAMQGLMASPSDPASVEIAAEWSYKVADAMLEARKPTP